MHRPKTVGFSVSFLEDSCASVPSSVKQGLTVPTSKGYEDQQDGSVGEGACYAIKA